MVETLRCPPPCLRHQVENSNTLFSYYRCPGGHQNTTSPDFTSLAHWPWKPGRVNHLETLVFPSIKWAWNQRSFHRVVERIKLESSWKQCLAQSQHACQHCRDAFFFLFSTVFHQTQDIIRCKPHPSVTAIKTRGAGGGFLRTDRRQPHSCFPYLSIEARGRDIMCLFSPLCSLLPGPGWGPRQATPVSGSGRSRRECHVA